jgi:Raf kinase inhibitor-like YbhB/YbcL family protein
VTIKEVDMPKFAWKTFLGTGLVLGWSAVLSPAWAGGKAVLKIQSTSFKAGDYIPDKYTCKGDNISPEISWSGAPPGTKDFALIVDDPDAPTQTWVHWVIFNIPAKPKDPTDNTYELLANFPRDEKTESGILQGLNDFRKIGYDGPCPPQGGGPHRYYFKLYALDAPLPLVAGDSKAQVLKAMKGHILAWNQMVGIYGK